MESKFFFSFCYPNLLYNWSYVNKCCNSTYSWQQLILALWGDMKVFVHPNCQNLSNCQQVKLIKLRCKNLRIARIEITPNYHPIMIQILNCQNRNQYHRCHKSPKLSLQLPFRVRSCLLITVLICQKVHKSLGLLLWWRYSVEYVEKKRLPAFL